MKRRKKKGSSLLMVIAIFGILTILGTSILGVVTANYKLRKEENERIKNLYSAESGIDEAYVVMCRVIDEAINEGVNAGEKLGNESTIEKRNIEFRRTFVNYINKKDEGELCKLEKEVASVSKGDDTDGKKVSIIGKLEKKDSFEDRNFTITSTFEDENKKNRTVEVTYKIRVPESYKDIKTVDGQLTPIINYSIATDENLNISNCNSNSFAVNGDIWVKGKKDKNTNNKIDFISGKYAGGIIIDRAKVNFKNEVKTASNISIDDHSDISCDKNVFAENILLGNNNNKDEARQVKFEGKGNVNLANDLVVSCNDARCDIGSLYAFNDLNIDKVRSSSSIIINSMNWPKTINSKDNGHLKVDKEAYIMGAAYINTKSDEKYQTGESVAYKGNYKAYTVPLDGDEQFTYIDPLMLVTSKGGKDLDINSKSDYFVNYNSKFKLRTEGITLPEGKTFTVGASISKGKVTECNASESLKDKKSEYVREVYNMGTELDAFKENYEDKNFENDFKETNINKTVASEINWEGVDLLVREKGNFIESNNDKTELVVIVNNDDNKSVSIINQNSNIVIGDKEKKYDKDKKYLIVSEGEVNIKDIRNFHGAVISKKNIDISGAKDGFGINSDDIDYKDKDYRNIFNLIFCKEGSFTESKSISSADVIETGKWILVK